MHPQRVSGVDFRPAALQPIVDSVCKDVILFADRWHRDLNFH